MKKILVLISLMCVLILILFISNQNKLNEKEHKATTGNMDSSTTEPNRSDTPDQYSDTILYYDNSNILSEDKTKDGKLPDVVCLDRNLDEKQKEKFIKIYLQERDIDKETSDGVAYYNEKSIAEYYMDQEKRKISFVFHILSDMPTDGIVCITLNMDELKEIGTITYQTDQKSDSVSEALYDTTGNLAAQLAYQYIPNTPFPFITEYKDTSNYKESIGDVLYNGQRFWFYKDRAQFDESGNWVGYVSDLYNPDEIKSNNELSYDKTGKLIKIESKLSETDISNYVDKDNLTQDDFVISELNLSYQENGMLDYVKYSRSPQVYGTTSDTGEIRYDEKGRMIYESSYITHGTIYKYYLYNKDDRKPWACITLDSMPYSGSQIDGIDYDFGNYYSIYMYQPN